MPCRATALVSAYQATIHADPVITISSLLMPVIHFSELKNGTGPQRNGPRSAGQNGASSSVPQQPQRRAMFRGSINTLIPTAPGARTETSSEQSVQETVRSGWETYPPAGPARVMVRPISLSISHKPQATFESDMALTKRPPINHRLRVSGTRRVGTGRGHFGPCFQDRTFRLLRLIWQRSGRLPRRPLLHMQVYADGVSER